MNLRMILMAFMMCFMTGESMFEDKRDEIDLPILMYHHLVEEIEDSGDTMVITPKRFEEHIVDMLDNGYTPVFLEDVLSYVEEEKKLPEKPICITFDDGYYSNYEYAFPILKKYNVKANIAVIGSSIGAFTYKDTEVEIIPHFTMEQAREMEESGLVSIISHTYDMHQSEELEMIETEDSKIIELIRVTAKKLENETEEEYELALTKDFNKMSEILKEDLNGKVLEILAYPYGDSSELANKILKKLGVKMTLATSVGINKIQKGNLDCLYDLHRYTVYEGS